MVNSLDTSVVSEYVELEDAGAFDIEQWSSFIQKLLGQIVTEVAAGKSFLGHIKATLHVDHTVIFGSTTGGQVTLRVLDDTKENVPAFLKVALIAYKTDHDFLARCLRQSLAEVGQDFQLGYQARAHDHSCDHPIDDHDHRD